MMPDDKPRLLHPPASLAIRRLPHGGYLVVEPGSFPGQEPIILRATDSLTMAISWMEMAMKGDASIVCQPHD